MKNYLPPIPKQPESAKPALVAYQQLGVMALLDIDFFEGASNIELGPYYDECVLNLQRQTAFIKLDDEKKPVGYVFWEPSEDTPSTITLTRQSAPFGDYAQLQASLHERLTEIETVFAKHEGSAREVQVAWNK